MALTKAKLMELIDNGDIDVALMSYPVGAIYQSTVSTSPATLFGGTWSAIGGRFLIGADGTYVAGSTGGTVNHDHATPIYRESTADGVYFTPWNSYGYGSGGAVTVPYGAYGTVYPTGTPGSKVAYPLLTSAVSNIPPYLAVYIWRRTA